MSPIRNDPARRRPGGGVGGDGAIRLVNSRMKDRWQAPPAAFAEPPAGLNSTLLRDTRERSPPRPEMPPGRWSAISVPALSRTVLSEVGLPVVSPPSAPPAAEGAERRSAALGRTKGVHLPPLLASPVGSRGGGGANSPGPRGHSSSSLGATGATEHQTTSVGGSSSGVMDDDDDNDDGMDCASSPLAKRASSGEDRMPFWHSPSPSRPPEDPFESRGHAARRRLRDALHLLQSAAPDESIHTLQVELAELLLKEALLAKEHHGAAAMFEQLAREQREGETMDTDHNRRMLHVRKSTTRAQAVLGDLEKKIRDAHSQITDSVAKLQLWRVKRSAEELQLEMQFLELQRELHAATHGAELAEREHAFIMDSKRKRVAQLTREIESFDPQSYAIDAELQDLYAAARPTAVSSPPTAGSSPAAKNNNNTAPALSPGARAAAAEGTYLGWMSNDVRAQMVIAQAAGRDGGGDLIAEPRAKVAVVGPSPVPRRGSTTEGASIADTGVELKSSVDLLVKMPPSAKGSAGGGVLGATPPTDGIMAPLPKEGPDNSLPPAQLLHVARTGGRPAASDERMAQNKATLEKFLGVSPHR